jgi:hypothetical protein
LIVTKLVRDELIGTAFAVFYVVEAIAIFFSNYIAGGLSSELASLVGLHKSAGPFIQGGLASMISLISLLNIRKKERRGDNNDAPSV